MPGPELAFNNCEIASKPSAYRVSASILLHRGGALSHDHTVSWLLGNSTTFLGGPMPDVETPQPSPEASGLRVLFLDVDGVICCNQNGALETDKLQNLVRVAKETGCKICLSSNWRLYDDLREYLYQQLALLGIECIGTTPDAGEANHGEPMRPCEIGAWIKFWNQGTTRPKIQTFVAVDDRPLTQENGGAFLRGALLPPIRSLPVCSGAGHMSWISPISMVPRQAALSRPTRPSG